MSELEVYLFGWKRRWERSWKHVCALAALGCQCFRRGAGPSHFHIIFPVSQVAFTDTAETPTFDLRCRWTQRGWRGATSLWACQGAFHAWVHQWMKALAFSCNCGWGAGRTASAKPQYETGSTTEEAAATTLGTDGLLCHPARCSKKSEKDPAWRRTLGTWMLGQHLCWALEFENCRHKSGKLGGRVGKGPGDHLV